MWELVGALIGIAMLIWLARKFLASRPNQPTVASDEQKQSPEPAEQPQTTEPSVQVRKSENAQPTTPELNIGSSKWLSAEESVTELTRNEDGELTFRVESREGELRFVGNNSDKQAAPGSTQLARLGIFYFNVRGHKYYPETRIRPGTRVRLQRESENPYDANAIAVTRFRSKAVYGYVNKGFARRLAKKIDSGQEHIAIVTGRGGITVAAMPSAMAIELGITGPAAD